MKRFLIALLTLNMTPIRFIIMLNSLLMILVLIFGAPFFSIHHAIIEGTVGSYFDFLLTKECWIILFAFHVLFIASSFFHKWNPISLFIFDGALGIIIWGSMMTFRVIVSVGNATFPIPFLISAGITIFILQWWVLIRHLFNFEIQNEDIRCSNHNIH
jgi:hypothetical protein